MEILPTPPTDNIYKFSAIFGLLGSAISFFIFIYFSYMLAHLEAAVKLQQESYLAQNAIEKVNCRISAIANNQLDKCKFENISINDGSPAEIEVLEYIKKSQIKVVNEYKNHVEISSPISENIKWLKNSTIYLMLIFIPSAFLILFIYGFKNWCKIQKNENKLSKLNYQIRVLEKKRLELEILKQKRSFNQRL